MKYKKPIEMPRGTHYGNNYFIVYSRKEKRCVKLFSNIEYYNFLKIEMDPDIVALCEQFDEIRFPVDGEEITFIPDMITEDVQGRLTVVEVKTSADLSGQGENAKRTQRQIKAESAWCQAMGYAFEVRTEDDYLSQKYLMPNLHHLAERIRRYYSNDNSSERYIRRLFDGAKELTVADIIDSCKMPSGYELDALAELYYLGVVNMELRKLPLCGRTKVKLREKGAS